MLPALVIILREIAVSGLREFLAEAKVSLPVSRLAKWKTAIQMIALGALILGQSSERWWPGLPAHEVGVVALFAAALLTLVTGWDYLRVGLRHMGPA
jgi:CDP-diacylglycerol--glycerol-3-phosphate 3-phosphatidyltransferase/cardiolipin synthase